MLAMASSTGNVGESSSNALAVGLWDAQQLEKMSSGANDFPAAAGRERKPVPINPLLLASASFGSWTALNYLFSKEDKQAPPMVQPTQVFLDLLVGYPAGNNTKGRFNVQQTSEDVENVVDQSASPTTALLLNGVTAEGDTALHVVASHGDGGKKFLKCAIIIFKRDQELLFAVNKKGDTPFHSAARAGKSKMLSCLVDLAESCNRLHELLRKENVLEETALHDAVRIGRDDIVELLLGADPDLANYPREGTSPLYLAILLTRFGTACTLYDTSNGNLSYSGPNGQNALHAAVLRCKEMTEVVLGWNNSLTTQGDKDGSTPLHFASSLPEDPVGCRQLFEANPAAVYQADNNGLFPIHVAASVGAKENIEIILQKCPSSARLRTAQGQTFLHVAVENKCLNIVSFVSQTPSLSSIMNMQDNDGNTALHLAIKTLRLRLFCSLYENKEVNLSLPNNQGQTPIDLSATLLPYVQHILNIGQIIYNALTQAHACHGGLRMDQIIEKYYLPLTPEDKIKEAEKMKDASQILGIGSVLIATVAFGATFAVPGGFIADDHKNAGTPTLAGMYTFDAFMVANALAFICSTIVTVGLMFAGSPMIDLRIRMINFQASVFFMSSSVTSLTASFALGVYMVLAPVTRPTAIAICAFSPLVVLFRNFDDVVKLAIVARPLYVRMGPLSLRNLALGTIARMLMELWPFILIFSWATIAQKIRNH